jgi:hypothetical protein
LSDSTYKKDRQMAIGRARLSNSEISEWTGTVQPLRL